MVHSSPLVKARGWVGESDKVVPWLTSDKDVSVSITVSITQVPYPGM